MPFFQQSYVSPEATLLQFLSQLDQTQTKVACAPRPAKAQTFTPRFDVTEVDNAYELYGELPGIEQKDLEIVFTDAQTIVVKGKTQRVRGPAAAAAAAGTPEPEVEAEDTDTASEKSHTATVEDEYDEADTPLPTPATTTAAAPEPQAETPAPAPKPKTKLWVSERKVGSFARSFSFSQRIDQDGVQAVLKNGILHVVVPKSQKSKTVAVSIL
jgi:HSP20 family protein